MPSSYQLALREAYATARSDVVYLDTLEISNPAVPSIYIVRDRADHVMGIGGGVTKTFRGVAFRLSLPDAGDTGLQELSLAIDNVGGEVTSFVKAVLNSSDPVEVIFRPYLSNDLMTPQMDPPLTLYLTDIVINAVEITGRATFADLLNRKFLSELYTRRRFPTLGT